MAHLGLVRGGTGIRVFDSRDSAIEWIEDRVLEAHGWTPEEEGAALALGDIEVFSELDAATISELSGAVSELRVPAGGTICSRGDAGDELFLVRSGRVSALLPAGNGQAPPRGHLLPRGLLRRDGVHRPGATLGQRRSRHADRTLPPLTRAIRRPGDQGPCARRDHLRAAGDRHFQATAFGRHRTASARGALTRRGWLPGSPQSPEPLADDGEGNGKQRMGSSVDETDPSTHTSLRQIAFPCVRGPAFSCAPSFPLPCSLSPSSAAPCRPKPGAPCAPPTSTACATSATRASP